MKTLKGKIMVGGIIIPMLIFSLYGFHNITNKNSSFTLSSDSFKQHTNEEITVEDISFYIRYFTSDSLKGRKSGTNEELQASEYIRNKFVDLGLKCYSNSYFQSFSFAGKKEFNDCSLRFENFNGILNRDFRPIIQVDSSRVSSEIAFVGYGYKYSKNGQIIDNYEGINVKGKWVMLFENNIYNNNKTKQDLMERYKIAQQKGASGLLSITMDRESNGQLVSNAHQIYSSSDFTMPLISISQKTSDRIFKHVGLSAIKVLDSISKSNKCLNFKIPVTLEGSVYSKRDSVHSRNVIAYLEGKDPILKNEFIIVGAHYDHLGGQKIQTISGESLLLYHGADDNASGTAGLLELAEKLSWSDVKLKRSIIFVAFGAEESGLKGSHYLSDNLPFSKNKIALMINLDMIGRMDTCHSLYVNTALPNIPLENTLKKMNSSHPTIKLLFKPNKNQKTDFMPFYAKGIPVVSFTTGVHKQLHTPNDTIGLLDLEGERGILNFIYDLLITKTNATGIGK